MSAKKINIRELSLDEIKSSLKNLGEQDFRGKQIYEWLWQKDAFSFEDMTNLSISLLYIYIPPNTYIFFVMFLTYLKYRFYY